MAKGWESKSVESQIDAAADAKSRRSAEELTSAHRERLARRASLELARTKTARDLAATQNPRYRAILERALADLDAQLAAE